MSMYKSALTLNNQINMQLQAQKMLREANDKCNQYARCLPCDGTCDVSPCAGS